jgi:hypothetical protein
MWRIADEIWNHGRLDLNNALIAEDLVDHVELQGLSGSGHEDYRANVEMTRATIPDYRNLLDFVMADAPFHGHTCRRAVFRCADIRQPSSIRLD